MTTTPDSYQQYLKRLEGRLNTLSMQNNAATEPIDKISVCNALLVETANLLKEILRLQLPKPTPKFRMLAMKVVVATAGTPVQFPYGKPINREVRLSTVGNTGDVFLGESYAGVKDTIHRFTINEDSNIPYKVSELSNLWVDADNDDDAIEVIGEIEAKQ